MGMLTVFLRKGIVFVVSCYLGIAVFLYFSQELFIFPVLLNQFFEKSDGVQHKPSLAYENERFFVQSADGESIEVLTNLKKDENPKNVAIIFHGNGETIDTGNFLPFFRKQGIPAFTFDYRGYGRSSGWPSEEGLYLDAEAVWLEVQKRTGLAPKDLIILGNSIGTGPGSYLAKKLSPKALILIAAYSDFPSLIAGMPLYAPFRFILRYQLPVSNYLNTLKHTCVILAHGKRDSVIPFKHLENIKSQVGVMGNLNILVSEEAGHNDIFDIVEDKLLIATQECLKPNA